MTAREKADKVAAILWPSTWAFTDGREREAELDRIERVLVAAAQVSGEGR